MADIKPIPDGYHTITPYLVVNDARAAIQFYKEAFGAKELCVLAGPAGRVMHAEIQIGDSNLMLSDEYPGMDVLGPLSRGGATSSLMIYVKDVDQLFEQAVKAGCTVKLPLTNQFWGDRYAKLADPFGHQWAIATHVEDVSGEEIDRRSKEIAKQMASAV